MRFFTKSVLFIDLEKERMKKLLTCLAVLLSHTICFVDQSAGSCNCQSSPTLQDNQESNNTTKVINTFSQTNKSTKSIKEQEEEEQFKKELQELQEFLEQSEEKNGNSK